MELTPTQEAAVTGAVAGSMVTITILMTCVIGIIFIIAWWKLFKKAGLAGWKSIIPFYNTYCLFRISGMSGWWFLLPVISSILVLCGGSYVYDEFGNIAEVISVGPLAIIGLIGAIASVVVEIIQNVKLAKNFGKGVIFQICAVFFTPITTLILAFGSAKFNKKALHA